MQLVSSHFVRSLELGFVILVKKFIYLLVVEMVLFNTEQSMFNPLCISHTGMLLEISSDNTIAIYL